MNELAYIRNAAKHLLPTPKHSSPILGVGLESERMGNVKQVNFISGIGKQNKNIVVNDRYEEGNIDVAKGKRTFPNTKDYYMGEPNGGI
jgi:hypothetical protein